MVASWVVCYCWTHIWHMLARCNVKKKHIYRTFVWSNFGLLLGLRPCIWYLPGYICAISLALLTLPLCCSAGSSASTFTFNEHTWLQSLCPDHLVSNQSSLVLCCSSGIFVAFVFWGNEMCTFYYTLPPKENFNLRTTWSSQSGGHPWALRSA